MQSFQIALRSHKEEKLNALRNAVINTAKPMFPEDDIYLMFINWIDAFTPWHLRILNYLNEIKLKEISMETTKDVIIPIVDKVMSNFPELVDQPAFTNRIIKELYDRGLILMDVDPHTPIRGEGNRYDLYESYTTAMGKKFLIFINENVDLHFNF